MSVTSRGANTQEGHSQRENEHTLPLAILESICKDKDCDIQK